MRRGRRGGGGGEGGSGGTGCRGAYLVLNSLLQPAALGSQLADGTRLNSCEGGSSGGAQVNLDWRGGGFEFTVQGCPVVAGDDLTDSIPVVAPGGS